MEQQVLAVNPGSSSRKYAIYNGPNQLISAYYEHEGDGISCTITTGSDSESQPVDLDLSEALPHFLAQAESQLGVSAGSIDACGVRVVAPGRFFLAHHRVNNELISAMENYKSRAPLHIEVSLQEIQAVQSALKNTPIFALSDSEFHKTLLHEARNYAIPRSDANEFDVYRFGYHG